MTTEELYYEFHLLVNKNNSQQNINVDKPHFVQLFNREYDRWLYEVLNTKNKDNSINDIQELLLSNIELKVSEIKDGFVIYNLPDNFFNYSECKIVANKENSNKLIYVYNIHPKEINVYIQDEFNKPSFEWEETIATISDNKLQVYKTDFSINKCYLSYYKASENVDLEGYKRIDGSMSKNVNINLSSIYQRQILDRVAKEFARQYENTTQFQLAQERALN